VEDEEHFLLLCKNNETLRNILFKDLLFYKKNETLRNILFKDIAEENPNFIDYSNFEKLVILLNTLSFCQVKRTRSFNKQSLEQGTVDC